MPPTCWQRGCTTPLEVLLKDAMHTAQACNSPPSSASAEAFVHEQPMLLDVGVPAPSAKTTDW